MFENFETNLDEYFYNMTYSSLEKLSQEDEEYKACCQELQIRNNSYIRFIYWYEIRRNTWVKVE